MKRLALSVFAASIGAALSACSSAGGPDAEGSISRTRSAVIDGEPSDSSQNSVVLLVHYDPRSGSVGSCTGTLLSDRLVLTARHCVADTDESAACKANGDPIALGEVRRNHKPETLLVFTGEKRPRFGRERVEPSGVGAEILDDGGDNLCNHDIALLVLEEPIENASIASIRLDGDVEKGELITAVGWGVTDESPFPSERQQRSGVKILGVGPDARAALAVPPHEFEVGESICSGDSGGPAFDEETGAIVGVVSRGGNLQPPDQDDPAANCIDGSNLYTKVSPFKDLILQGFELVGAEPWVEGGPDPRKLKANNACSDGSECRSDMCLVDPAGSDGSTTCADACTSDSECSDGQKCVTDGDVKACRNPAPKDEGGGLCSYAPASRSSNGGTLGLALLFACAVGVSRRRRRARRL